MDNIKYKKTALEVSIEDGSDTTTTTSQANEGVIPLSSEEQSALMRKVTLRIVPFLSFLYVLSYLDRASLSNVHKSILKDLHMDEDAYANAVGIFFLGYIMLGVPSNIALVIVKARVWLSGIMVTWGAMCILMMLVTNARELMVVRFFLGCAEAGFVPGVFLYLTYWFLPHERAKQLALFISSNAVAGLIGGLLSYGVNHLEGVMGLRWWQYLFLIEGASTVLFGYAIFFVLPDSPASATWLTEREKTFLIERFRNNNTESHSINLNLSRQQWFTIIKTTLADRFLWAFSVADFCSNGVMITITFFLPSIIQELGATQLLSNLLSAIPYACALVVMMINAIHSDMKQERSLHIIIPCVVALVFGGILSIDMLKDGSLYVQMALICGIVSCVWAIKGPFLAWMTYGLRGNNAIGIGIVNSIANISGWIGPSVQAAAYEASGGYVLGFAWQGGLLLLMIASIIVIIRWEKQLGSQHQPKQVENDQGNLLQEFSVE